MCTYGLPQGRFGFSRIFNYAQFGAHLDGKDGTRIEYGTYVVPRFCSRVINERESRRRESINFTFTFFEKLFEISPYLEGIGGHYNQRCRSFLMLAHNLRLTLENQTSNLRSQVFSVRAILKIKKISSSAGNHQSIELFPSLG